MNLPPRVTLASSADLLRWQVRWRVGVACLTSAMLVSLQLRGWLAGAPANVAWVLLAYAGAVCAAAAAARTHDPPARGWSADAAAHVTILADVAALIAVTAVLARPGHHDWVLVVSFFIVHLAGYSFGRRAGILALAAAATGYLWLTAKPGDSSAAEWSEAVVAVGAFVAVAAAFLAHHESRRRRLRRIIALFGRAEDGDFAEAYDVGGDARPDAITAVGGAYNRVRARFENLVLTDSLTRCLNRRGFEHALERELARADRAGSEVALLAIDIDGFKKVNDSFGHMAGDETLHQLGQLFLATARTGDVVGRVGGDEFVILCPDTDTDGAEQLGTRLCQQVGSHVFDGHALPVRVTISTGIASVRAAPGDHIASELKLRADRALYDAKRAGRNRVRCWEVPAGIRNPSLSTMRRQP